MTDLLIGELSTDSHSNNHVCVTWKISDFRSLPIHAISGDFRSRHQDFAVQSPSFAFANATWCLRAFPDGRYWKHSIGYLDLTIRRLHTSVPMHTIFYEVGVKESSNETFRQYNDICYFKKNSSEFGAVRLIDYFIIGKGCDDTQIFFCKMKIVSDGRAAIDVACQTISHDFLPSSVDENVAEESTWKSINCLPEEVMEERPLGELSTEIHSRRVDVTWKIARFPSLPGAVDSSVISPEFTFANATWFLRVYRHGQSKCENIDTVCLSVVRLNTKVPCHNIFYEFGIKNRENGIYKQCNGICYMDENSSASGVVRIIGDYDVRTETILRGPDETFTFFCHMRTISDETVAIDGSCQTETHEHS